MSVVATTDEPERVEPNSHPIGLRVYDDQFGYIERLRRSNDVDRTRLLRRMIRFCQLNMPDNWVPPVED